MIWKGFIYTYLWVGPGSFNADNTKYEDIPLFLILQPKQLHSLVPSTEDKMIRKSSFDSSCIHCSVITLFHGEPQWSLWDQGVSQCDNVLFFALFLISDHLEHLRVGRGLDGSQIQHNAHNTNLLHNTDQLVSDQKCLDTFYVIKQPGPSLNSSNNYNKFPLLHEKSLFSSWIEICSCNFHSLDSILFFGTIWNKV